MDLSNWKVCELRSIIFITKNEHGYITKVPNFFNRITSRRQMMAKLIRYEPVMSLRMMMMKINAMLVKIINSCRALSFTEVAD